MSHALIDQLRELYSASTQVEAAIPSLSARVESAGLREALQRQFDETGRQILRLQQVIEHIGASARGPRCLAMAALLRECEETAALASSGPIMDTVIITGLRRVLQYEIAGFRAARAYARTVEDCQVELLQVSLEEQIGLDDLLDDVLETEWQDGEVFAEASHALEQRE